MIETTWMLHRMQYASVRIALAKRVSYREILSWDFLTRNSPLRIRDYVNYPDCSLIGGPQQPRSPNATQRIAKGWLTPFRANQLFESSLHCNRSAARQGNGGTERGASPRAANLKAYHKERERQRERELRAGRKREREKIHSRERDA